MKCAKHKDKNAITYCANCGRGVCESCLVETSEDTFCRECFRGEKSPQNITNYAVNEILHNKIVLIFIVGVILLIVLLIITVSISNTAESIPGDSIVSQV